jgi:hypothetical protein
MMGNDDHIYLEFFSVLGIQFTENYAVNLNQKASKNGLKIKLLL